MHTRMLIQILGGMLVLLFMLACSISVVKPTPTPAPTATPTLALPTATEALPTPTQTATPEFAPFCQAGAAAPMPACEVPLAVQSSTFCTDKDPYTLIVFDQGASYQVTTPGFRCTDAGKKGDQKMITCTGQMAARFSVNFCNPVCVLPTVEAALTACPAGYNYDNTRGCCTDSFLMVNQNCRAYEFTTTTCIVNCWTFKKEKTCNQNSYACYWNAEEKVCQLRR